MNAQNYMTVAQLKTTVLFTEKTCTNIETRLAWEIIQNHLIPRYEKTITKIFLDFRGKLSQVTLNSKCTVPKILKEEFLPLHSFWTIDF